MIEKQQIIISYYRQGMSQREISQSMKLNRKTVKRYVDQYLEERGSQSGEHGVVEEPKYDSSSRKKVRLSKSVVAYIDNCLAQNLVKRQKGLSKQCMAGTDIHEGLLSAGYQVSYRTVSRYIKAQKLKGQEIFIKQKHAPGRAVEFDWGRVVLKIGNKQKNLMLAVFTLCYSNHRWARLFYREDMPSFLDAHVKYLAHIGGVPMLVVYDNMKVAVAQYSIRQADKKPTQDLLKISSYYQFDFRFCNAFRGNEKGHVEKSVGYVRRKSFSQNDEFETLQQANEHLEKILTQLNDKPIKGSDITIAENFQEEAQCFASLPPAEYEVGTIARCKIDKYHTIQIDTNHYSVPETIRTSVACVKIYPTAIQILDEQGKLQAVHERKQAKGQWVIDINHYWKSLRCKPGALPSSVALYQADDLIKQLSAKYFLACPRDFIEVMGYCQSNQIPLTQLENILIKHQHLCLNSEPSSEKIIFLLQESMRQEKPLLDQIDEQELMSAMIAEQCTQQLQQIQNLIH